MKRKMRTTLAGSAIVAALAAGPLASARAVQTDAAGRTVTINFVETPVVDVLKALAMQTHSNIVAGPEVASKISIAMKDVDLTGALDMVTRLNNLAYRQENGTYIVSTAARLKEMYPAATSTSVYTLTSVKPADAVSSITKMIPALLAQPQGTSMVTLTGNTEEVAEGRSLLAQMEGANAAANGERQTEVYNLKYLNPLEAERALAGLVPDVLVTVSPGRSLPGTGGVGSSANGSTEQTVAGGSQMDLGGATTPGAELKTVSVKFNPGEEPTDILITGYAAGIAHARALLDQLDLAPRQVQITARVVDLSRNDALNLGLDYTFGPLSISESQFPAGDPAAGFATSSEGHVLSFGKFARLPFKANIGVNAFGSRGHSKVLANPTINAINNRPARIFIGDTVTYLTSQSVAPTTGALTLTTEKDHVGIGLLVTPRISGDGTITLEVHPNVSVITGFDNFGTYSSPRISERSIDTTIRLKDGETAVMGGLMRDDEIKTMSSVPFLSKLPIFGELFKHRNNSSVHSDITLFLTARIVKDDQ